MKNSRVADGCIIEAEVENCIIFKGVKIGKGSVVKDSILMQDTIIGENAKISCVIADKDVGIRSGVELAGARTFPVCLSKNTKI
jgi:glucose-1-phosphate adenylyltransferase